MRFLFAALGTIRAQRRQLGECIELAGEAVHVREHAERGRVAGLRAPQLVREVDRAIGVAIGFGLLQL